MNDAKARTRLRYCHLPFRSWNNECKEVYYSKFEKEFRLTVVYLLTLSSCNCKMALNEMLTDGNQLPALTNHGRRQ